VKDVVIVFLTGGRAKRLWPLAEKLKGKCFFSLSDTHHTVLDKLFSLAKKMVPRRDIYFVANREQSGILKKKFRVASRNILVEPLSRNTFTAVLYCLARLRERYRDKIVLVMPTDCIIGDERRFREAVNVARSFIARTGSPSLVLFGVKPYFASTDFGYIRKKLPSVCVRQGTCIYKVDAFIEKPRRRKAVTFIKDSDYLWNAGIFMGAQKSFERLCAASQPGQARRFFGKVFEGMPHKELSILYRASTDISFDNAVLERPDHYAVIESDIQWQDTGNWASVAQVLSKDKNNNTVCGPRFAGLDVNNTFIFSSSPQDEVVAIGIKDIVMIKHGNKILLAHTKSAARLTDVAR